ncbi:hypothetical protein GNIT_1593 [Glaciecola nitratireducens FR1064]|uniref:Uncharacterized protein n=1 Tax=Glaciecola nitratireducens (strain JCM 12485 / KCTC 12276 / FR1064) TaxID=1085623 RepID=G4QH79_GLANF|nr:hypothetical protein GNIT_1593 [Glaciecola nitratireducens FR1064]
MMKTLYLDVTNLPSKLMLTSLATATVLKGSQVYSTNTKIDPWGYTLMP